VTDIAQTIVREPATKDAEQYAGRVHLLALAYASLFAGSVAGIALIVWQGQFLVTLTQRSNVETLLLGFFLVFFAYMALVSARGAWGAVRIARFALLARLSDDRVDVERRKAEAARHPPSNPPTGAMNLVVEQAGRPGEPFQLRAADAAGEVATLEVDGARLIHRDALGSDSNSLLAYFVEQVNEVLGERVGPARLDIVAWKTIDDELTESYLAQVRFARNLERQLGAEELWPKARLTDEDCHELERRLAAICPALRDETFLPDWEYEAEHKVPLIPEPLGIASLARTERRADPVTSMGCAAVVVLIALLAFGLLIAFPPWVPGT
jgi:hypothetical protein